MSDQPQRQTQPTGPGNGPGGFTRTPETAQRDADAARLRGRGWSYRRIAAELGIDVHTAHDAVQRALKAIVEEPAQEVRQLELERLDAMYDAVMKVLETKHFTVSQGRLIKIDEEPLEDDAPVLAAVDRLLKIQARRAALLGLDAPTKVEQGGKLTYEIVGVDLGEL
jgi:hypothetical protein